MSDITREKILEGAKQCFFQHGYTKATITLISDYAGFSRVTVHKHFKNKEELFVAVFEAEMAHKLKLAKAATASNLPIWQNIEQFLLSICSNVFENIKDQYILQDLHRAANHEGKEVKKRHQQIVIAFIQQQLEMGETRGEVSLSALGFSADRFALLIDTNFIGILMNAPFDQAKNLLQDQLKIYQQATKVIVLHT